MELFQALAAGGDVAMIAIAAAFWRFDRRVLSIENFLKLKLNFGD